MSQLMPRGYVRLATLAVCLLVVLTKPSQSAAGESESLDNEAPSVSITSPADGATYAAGDTIPFSATVNGQVDGVAFWVNSVLYEIQYAEPYGISLPNAAAGVYTLEVVVWDNAGGKAWDSGTVTVLSSSGSWTQAPSVSITSPADGATYTAGATIPFSASVSGKVDGVAFWVNSVLYMIQYASPYGISLPNVAAGTYRLEVVAWNNAGGNASASRTVTVLSSSGSGTQGPSVSITSPAEGSTYAVGATVPFSASVSGTVNGVAFWVNSVLQEIQYASPYGISLPNVAAGTYSLEVVVWNNAGGKASASRTLTVGSSSIASNQPPVVSLTAPASGATFTAPASITVSATATDVDGTIAQVDFYSSGTLIRTDTSAPYSYSWNNVGEGGYSLTAVARDNAGATTVSSTIDITVKPANLSGTAVFAPSSNHATAVDRYVLEVFPVGADPTVANPVATRDLGKPAIVNGECSVDVSSTILALTPGTYVATVTAMGSGGSAQSAPSPSFTR